MKKALALLVGLFLAVSAVWAATSNYGQPMPDNGTSGGYRDPNNNMAAGKVDANGNIGVADPAAATLLTVFGNTPPWNSYRNQIVFRDRFIRPDNTDINSPGSNNSMWIINPGSSIGVTNNSPYVVVSNGNDSMLQNVGVSDAYVQVVMGAEYIASNVGVNVRMLSDTDGIEIDNLGNGTFSIYDMASGGVTGNATTRYSPAAVTIGNNFGVEVRGRTMNIYINTFLIDTINLDTAGFDNHLNAATKYGLTLYGITGSAQSFTDFFICPFKQELMNPTPSPTPFTRTVFNGTQVVGATAVTLAVPTPGWDHDIILTENNGNDTSQYVGSLATGSQTYGNFKIQSAQGIELMCIDGVGGVSSIFTGQAGVTTNLSGIIFGHPHITGTP